MKVRYFVLTFVLILFVVGMPIPGGDGYSDVSAAEKNVPKNHTVDKNGALHAPGTDDAVKKCGACHGKDLKGGKKGPSCFECHDQNW